MKDFILENWKLLLILLCDVVLLVLTILKKNKIITKDTALGYISERLPVLIRQVEDKGLDGSNKKAFVMSYALRLLGDFTGLSSAECFEKYHDKLDQLIEDILSTPQKKEVK